MGGLFTNVLQLALYWISLLCECLWAGVTCEDCCGTYCSEGRWREEKDQRPSSNLDLRSYTEFQPHELSILGTVLHLLSPYVSVTDVLQSANLGPTFQGWTDMVRTTHKPRGFVDRGVCTDVCFSWIMHHLKQTNKWTDVWEVMQLLIAHLSWGNAHTHSSEYCCKVLSD